MSRVRRRRSSTEMIFYSGRFFKFCIYVIWILWNCKMVNQWSFWGYISCFGGFFGAGWGIFNDLLRSGWGVCLFNDLGWIMMELKGYRFGDCFQLVYYYKSISFERCKAILCRLLIYNLHWIPHSENIYLRIFSAPQERTHLKWIMMGLGTIFGHDLYLIGSF